MANPITVDCGGSTRIKRILQNGAGAMNGLLDVDPALNPPRSTEVVNRPYSDVNVVCITSDGGMLPVLTDCPIAGGDNFTVTSESGQKVLLQINAANTSLTITIQGQPGNPPIVEAKHFNKKRRYVVINAGAIQSITGTANGAPFPDFNAPANSIYVTLVLNE